jgi:hypothetical protein
MTALLLASLALFLIGAGGLLRMYVLDRRAMRQRVREYGA